MPIRSKRLKLMVSAIALAATTGCATIASGTSQSISISTNVEGATLFLDANMIGTTPYTGEVPKNKEQIRIELEGYRTETLSLSKSLDPIFWGNIIIGGTLGSITDFATGAAYEYSPATYQVDLQRSEQSEEDFLHEVVVRKFSMIYIDEIALDVSNGGGEYLDALTELVGMRGAPTTKKAVVEALVESQGDPVVFGNATVALR